MNIKPVLKGVTLGATIGAMVYVVSKSSPKQKRELKRSTGKALRAFGTVVDGFTSMIN
ncbi:MAG: hypothetical protein GX365_00760 [Clostridiales bacterium]|nr:hypothetical protein [Clostridiales bacterium]